jgi:broad specificity phosphatase PhoE
VFELVFVRHGETVARSSIRLYGATDVALAPDGLLQARAAGLALGGFPADRVCTSPLVRARSSTTEILSAMDRSELCPKIVEGFREVNFGDWEGWTLADVETRAPDLYRAMRGADPDFGYPGGETRRAFAQRVAEAIDREIDDAMRSGSEHVLVVAHKGVIKRALAHLLHLDALALERMTIALGSIHRLRSQGDGFVATGLDTAEHLVQPP